MNKFDSGVDKDMRVAMMLSLFDNCLQYYELPNYNDQAKEAYRKFVANYTWVGHLQNKWTKFDTTSTRKSALEIIFEGTQLSGSADTTVSNTFYNKTSFCTANEPLQLYKDFHAGFSGDDMFGVCDYSTILQIRNNVFRYFLGKCESGHQSDGFRMSEIRVDFLGGYLALQNR